MKNYCWLGIHKWSKWVDKRLEEISQRHAWSDQYIRIGEDLIQERRCEQCNKCQSKRIRF